VQPTDPTQPRLRQCHCRLPRRRSRAHPLLRDALRRYVAEPRAPEAKRRLRLAACGLRLVRARPTHTFAHGMPVRVTKAQAALNAADEAEAAAAEAADAAENAAADAVVAKAVALAEAVAKRNIELDRRGAELQRQIDVEREACRICRGWLKALRAINDRPTLDAVEDYLDAKFGTHTVSGMRRLQLVVHPDRGATKKTAQAWLPVLGATVAWLREFDNVSLHDICVPLLRGCVLLPFPNQLPSDVALKIVELHPPKRSTLPAPAPNAPAPAPAPNAPAPAPAPAPNAPAPAPNAPAPAPAPAPNALGSSSSDARAKKRKREAAMTVDQIFIDTVKKIATEKDTEVFNNATMQKVVLWCQGQHKNCFTKLKHFNTIKGKAFGTSKMKDVANSCCEYTINEDVPPHTYLLFVRPTCNPTMLEYSAMEQNKTFLKPKMRQAIEKYASDKNVDKLRQGMRAHIVMAWVIDEWSRKEWTRRYG